MSWFSDVTGRTDEQRQAWRDNFNDGMPAGDWTGNITRALQESAQAGSLGSGHSDGASRSGGEVAVTLVPGGAIARPSIGGATFRSDGETTSAAPETWRNLRATSALAMANGGMFSAFVYSPMAVESRTSRQTQIVWQGYPVDHMPDTSDGGDAEEAWGDLGGSIYGLMKMAGDGARTVANLTLTPQAQGWYRDFRAAAEADVDEVYDAVGGYRLNPYDPFGNARERYDLHQQNLDDFDRDWQERRDGWNLTGTGL